MLKLGNCGYGIMAADEEEFCGSGWNKWPSQCAAKERWWKYVGSEDKEVCEGKDVVHHMV